jgi:REP element-mobilizing transposase RayT
VTKAVAEVAAAKREDDSADVREREPRVVVRAPGADADADAGARTRARDASAGLERVTRASDEERVTRASAKAISRCEGDDPCEARTSAGDPDKYAMLIQMVATGDGQLELVFRARGGARKGAGRKPRAERVGMLPHTPRERHRGYQPVHVTARAVRLAPNLRSQSVFAVLRAIFARSSQKSFRLLHFSVQGNHLHFIAEADDGVAFARGVQRLLSRAAMAVNALARRQGKLWSDRHHREPLTTPSQVRNAYSYVLFNLRKHELASPVPSLSALLSADPCSSTLWFDVDGWSPHSPAPPAAVVRGGASIVAQPATWLARRGWKTRGLLRFDEVLRARRRPASRA